MAYPDSNDLEITVDAAWGTDLTTDPSTWTFTDLSSRLVAAPITINRGVLVGQGSHRSASATVTLTNADGYLTPMLATSPWYPYVDLGTPMRIRLRSATTAWISDTFTRTVASGWGTASSGQTWSASPGTSVTGTAGLFTFSAANQLKAATIGSLDYHDAWVMWDASLNTVSTGASHVCGCTVRSDGTGNNYVWAGAEFDVGGTVKWTIRTYLAGNEVIEQQVVQPSLTYTANQVLRFEVELIGDTLRARAWDPAGSAPSTWVVSVQLSQPLTTITGVNAGIRTWCVNGNTNTQPTVLTVDNLSFSQPRYPRIEGYITDVRPTFQPQTGGTTWSTVQIDIGGIGSRLEKQDDAELSPLRRSLEKSAIPPVVYWPCEDGQGATQAASAYPGGLPMIVNGPAVFDFDTGDNADAALHKYGTQNLCSIAAGASLLGLISPAVGSTAWTVSAAIAEYTPGIGGGVTEVRLFEWATPGGTFARWALVQTLTAFQVRAYNDTLGTVTTAATWTAVSGYLNLYDVACAQSGGSINVTLYANSFLAASGTVTGTLTGVSRVTVNPDKVNTTASVDPFGIRFIAGHVQVHDQALAGLPYYFDGSLLLRADQGWGYEYAHRRLLRLCDEEGVLGKVVGNPYSSGTTQLNVQQPGTFVPLVTAAAEAESGAIVYEDGFGYTMLPRAERYNASVAMTVDMATYQSTGDPTGVLVPKLDARGPNFWTVKRTNGSEATAAASTTYRKRRGTLRESATLDLLYDDDCAQHASWRVHVFSDGTQANYPNLVLDLAANPGLIDDYLRLKHGDRVQRTNQPVIAGLDTIDQVIDGMSETFTPVKAGGPSWTATLDCSPATVWQLGVFDTERWDSSSTTLGADVTSTDTVFLFSSTLKTDAWATDEPLMQVEVMGQTTTVQWMSSIGSIATVEGGMETGVSGWLPANGSVAQSSAFAHTGTYSLQLTATAPPSNCNISNNTMAPVVAGQAYTATAWVYSPTAVSMRMFASWYTSGAVFISSSVGSTIAVPANTWTQLTMTSAAAPGTAGLVRAGPSVQAPAAGTVVYIDDVDFTSDSAVNGTGPYVQKAWVVRDTTVTGAIKAGAEIHVSDPLWWGL